MQFNSVNVNRWPQEHVRSVGAFEISQCLKVLRNTFHKKKVLFADIGRK